MATAFAFRPSCSIVAGANICAIVADCRVVARQCGFPRSEIDEFTREVDLAPSYGAALDVVRKWFDARECA